FPSALSSVLFPLSLHDALPISILFVAFLLYHAHSLCQPDPRGKYIAFFHNNGLIVAIDHIAVKSSGRCSYAFLFFYFSIDHIYRSEEHTSELQSRENLVCRLLL